MIKIFAAAFADFFAAHSSVFYAAFVAAMLVALVFVKRRIDRTKNLLLPPIAENPDPFEIAYLRGGTGELARTAIFSLIRKNLAAADEGSNDVRLIHPANEAAKLAAAEKVALEWLADKRRPANIVNSDELSARLAPVAADFQTDLERRHLLADRKLRNNFAACRAAWCAAIIIAGAVWWFAAPEHTTVAVITTLGIAFAGLAAAAFIAAAPRVTNLGRAYNDALALAFDNLKLEAQTDFYAAAPSADPDPLVLAVAVFGAQILEGTTYNWFHKLYLNEKKES